MPSILNTIRNISMRLYSSVEEIVTMCSVKKTWGHGGSHVHTLLPPPQMKKKSPSPGVGFFCQNKLTRELKIRSVGSVLQKLFTYDKFPL